MAVERKRRGLTRAVSGQQWVEGGREWQDAEWDTVRLRWHQELQAGGWRPCGDLKETTEFDEELRLVRLHIRATCQREVGNVFIAPLSTQPGDPGWKVLGITDGPIHFSS